MKFLIIAIILLSVSFSSKRLPNDVRWLRDSQEYLKICESTFSSAYRAIKNKTYSNSEKDTMSYDIFLTSLKNENNKKIFEITCSKTECLGSYLEEDKSLFKVKIPSLSNYLIQQIKKNKIKYKFIKNLKDFTKTDNYAIIVDLDETILDNSQYQVMLHRKNEKFNPESWSSWVNKEEAELVPGAKQFLDKVRDLDVRVIFISNRMNKNLLPTINNLKNLNAFSDDDIFLLRLDKKDTKVVRRGEVFSQEARMEEYPHFSVISYLGDAIGDFPKDSSKCNWGVNCHVFPNPMYGKW